MALSKEKSMAEFNTAIFECFKAGCTMEEVAGEFNHAAPQAESEAEEKRENEQWEKDHEGDES